MLRADADLWPELGRVVTRFFGADLVVFFERRDGHQVLRYFIGQPGGAHQGAVNAGPNDSGHGGDQCGEADEAG